MSRTVLTIFHAGSFGPALQLAVQKFQQQRPDVRVVLEGAGARRVARWVCDEGRRCDLMALADEAVFEQFLRPRYVGFNLRLARNRLVLGYRVDSRYATEINADNWYQILQRPDVRLGHTDPEDDPGGYRAKLCWQLAERHYGAPGLAGNLGAKVPNDLIFRQRQEIDAAYTEGRLDYCFGYLSGARIGVHPWLALPPEVDLSDPTFAEHYRNASIELNGTLPGTRMRLYGQPIVYSVAIPLSAPEPRLAEAFLCCWLGMGPHCLADAGLIPLPMPELPRADLPALPPALRPFVRICDEGI